MCDSDAVIVGALITCKSASLCEPCHGFPLQDLAAYLCMDLHFIGLDDAQVISEQPAICFQLQLNQTCEKSRAGTAG